MKRDNKKNDEENIAESKAIIDALNQSNHISKLVIIGEKQNEIDYIEDKLEDTFMVAFSNKRIRLQKKLERLKKEVEVLKKDIESV